MKITILTLFPEMFKGPFDHSIVKIAQEKKLVEVILVNIRDFGDGKHKVADDTEYGGGVGMVMKADVLHKAIERSKIKNKKSRIKEKVILLSATGTTYNQRKAEEFSELDHLILICGHYEGVDERIKKYIHEEISVGDFVLTGGELPAMLITDSVTRLISGVLSDQATINESFSEINNEILLEYPHYTRPRVFDGEEVPSVLLSGNHAKIDEWRKEKAKQVTQSMRPDLLKLNRSKNLISKK